MGHAEGLLTISQLAATTGVTELRVVAVGEVSAPGRIVYPD